MSITHIPVEPLKKKGKCNSSASAKAPLVTFTKYTGCANSGEFGYKACSTTTALTGWLALLQQGPVSIVIDASGDAFNFYSSGYFKFATADCTQADHAVIAVGWGKDTKTGQYYIIIRNSWSDTWGVSGYIYVYLDQSNNNTCFITTQAIRPTAFTS